MTESTAHKYSFQAEVKQILDIVIHSLYTNREIFIRELISNAADALEKVRYEKVTNPQITDPDLPLEIRLEVDEIAKTITITDTGIGMNEQEVVENLGTIAHSGTREFLEKLKEGSQDLRLIGQFGVGFYSSFMAAKKIRVLTRSFRPDDAGVEWTSEGDGEFSVRLVEHLNRGTKIILNLRDDAAEFASKDWITRIIKEYSNFVPFPLFLQGEKLNTIQAIWTRNKNEVTEDEYKEFYKFVAKAYDEPLYRLHYTADAPLQINALLFVPDDHFERLGLGKLEPGVNLYCRRVLIQAHSDVLLPEWMRFVKGVVESEDLPLNISRETLQDNALVRKLGRAITSRFLKFLAEQAESNPETYARFWERFGMFLKEGVAHDTENRKELVKLLRFESSKTEPGKLTSLPDYFSRMAVGQEFIYYLNGPDRETIEAGPYVEIFRQKGIEVLYVHHAVDEFVLSWVDEFEGKKIKSGDQSDLELPDSREESQAEEELSLDEIESLSGWLKSILGDRVTSVRASKRLVESPALILSSDSRFSATLQRVIHNMNEEAPEVKDLILEFNHSHPILKQIFKMRAASANEEGLKDFAEQLFDTAMIAAGLLKDSSSMVQRSYRILERALRAT